MAKSHMSQSLTVHVVMINSTVKRYGEEVNRLSLMATLMASLHKNTNLQFQGMLTTYLSWRQLCFRKSQFERLPSGNYPA